MGAWKWILLGLGGGSLLIWWLIPAAESLDAGEQAGSRGAGDFLEAHGIGFVEPASEVRLLSFRVGGVIEACHVAEGQVALAGQALLTLEHAEESAAVRAAEQRLELARAEEDKVLSGSDPNRIVAAEHRVRQHEQRLEYLTRESLRQSSLFKSGAGSEAEHDRVDSDLEQTKAALGEARADLEYLRHAVRPEDRALAATRVRLAQQELEVVEAKLEQMFLRAPFEGTVLDLLRRPGESVRSTQTDPVIAFGDTSRSRVRAEIDERYVPRLRIGQKASITGRGLAWQVLSGRVVEIEKLMGEKTRFSGAATERRDLDVLQVVIEVDGELEAAIGLEVEVDIDLAD